MSNEAITEYLNAIRGGYLKAATREKTRILNEAVAVTGRSRGRVKRRLCEDARPPKERRRPGRPRVYGDELLGTLKGIWFMMEQPCGKKMRVILPRILPAYVKRHETPKAVIDKIVRMSASSIDRVLAKIRVERGICTTKPPTSSWYKSAIPVMPKDWNVTAPGYGQCDTVSHCGEDASGAFASTLTLTDIDSHWTELRATFTKKHTGIVDALRSIELSLPFTLHTIKFDSGSEFMNYEVVGSLRTYGPRGDIRQKPVTIYRSRPYRKNDNCYVEQKNLTHVRQFIGYERIESKAATRILNELYRDLWCPFLNFFMPTFKLLRKERVGSRIKKTYEKPKTPYERLLESQAISEGSKTALRNRYEALDPVELKLAIEEKLKLLHQVIREEGLSEELKLAG